MALWVTCSSSAARVKLWWRAAAAKARTAFSGGRRGDMRAISNPQIIQWMNQLEELFEELELLGCSYKDWNFTVGLVDFPSVIGGQQVFLCWRSDEKELRYYHEIDAGFTGRKLIPKEELS